MSLLTITQSLTIKVLSSKPTVAAASTDPKTIQAIEYINEAGQELGSRYNWQALTNESSFVTLAAEVQGTIQAIAGAGFSFIVNESMWNRTQRRPLFGPKSSSEWQNLKARFSSGPWISYRIRGNQLLFFPIPAAGQSVFFEWCTKFWATDILGSTPKSSFTVDTDVALLDERVITLDALWRFKRANKLSYDEDYQKAQDAINDLIVRDGSKPRLNLQGPPAEFGPGIFVSAGNW
jgi:hypothetical protein